MKWNVVLYKSQFNHWWFNNMDSKKLSTLQVDKRTQLLIRQYCFIHRINMKKFVNKLANEKLGSFKKMLEEIKKVRI